MRTLLISGASRGIGRSIANQALKDGYRISIGVRKPDELKGTELDPLIAGKDKVLLNRYEAKDEESASVWVENTLRSFHEFDGLINCAGIFHSTSLLFPETKVKEIEELWKVNVMGPWLLTKAAWPELVRSKKGRIIVLVSMSGKRSKGKLAGYTMSKFALMGLCQTMRNEGWEKNIRVTAICPSWVNTDMARNVNMLPKKMMTQPEDIAKITSNLLELPETSVPFEICLNCSLEK